MKKPIAKAEKSNPSPISSLGLYYLQKTIARLEEETTTSKLSNGGEDVATINTHNDIQAKLTQLSRLKRIYENHYVVDVAENPSTVGFGAMVSLSEVGVEDVDKETVLVLGPAEACLYNLDHEFRQNFDELGLSMIVSQETPVTQQMAGKAVGETFACSSKFDQSTYRIEGIEYLINY